MGKLGYTLHIARQLQKGKDIYSKVAFALLWQHVNDIWDVVVARQARINWLE